MGIGYIKKQGSQTDYYFEVIISLSCCQRSLSPLAWWQGSMAHLFVWQRELSASEISTLYSLNT